METTTRRAAAGMLNRLGWWVLFSVIAVYGAFALTMGVSELLSVIGTTPEIKHRALPLVFVTHALAGALVLFIGPLQSVPWIRRHVAVRRALGRTYVVAVWIASVAAIVDVTSFNVSAVAKILFVGVAALWFATTTIGMLYARARRFVHQHEWMVRSYSLSLFFVTFSLWLPALGSIALPSSVAYPLAQFLSAALNLAVAEGWIRWTRKKPRARGASRPSPRQVVRQMATGRASAKESVAVSS